MIYYNYYLEIKYRFSLIVFTWLSISFTCYFYREVLIFEIIDLTNYVGFSKTNPYFIFSDITDIFSISVILSCFVSNQICFFLFLYHFLVFLSPGLYSKEYYNFFNILKISFVYWIIAILFLNYVLFPSIWIFYLNFQEQINLSSIEIFFEANIKEYFIHYINLYYFCVINFQLSFLVLFVSTKFFITPKQVKNTRKLFYFVLFVLSSVVSPLDIFSQLLLTICSIFLYEFAIFYRILNKF